MIDTCTHIDLTVFKSLEIYQYDPTRTLSLRNAFAADMKSRFRKLTRLIMEVVVRDDVFGLKKSKMITFANPGYKAFDFATNPEKVDEFMKWLNHQVDLGVLQIKELNQIGQATNEAWTNKYISDSYKRGVLRARYEMKKAGFKVPSMEETGGVGVSMSTPFHIDRLGILYIRAFNELKGITAVMGTQISRILAQGIGDGDNPVLLAKKMVGVIEGGTLGLKVSYISPKTGKTISYLMPAERRAEIMARTEIVRAHHQAMIQEYENWGTKKVKVMAEWSTSGDTRVCSICSGFEGNTYTLKEIMNMIPYHPQCRCAALPVMTDVTATPVEDAVLNDKVAFNFKDRKDGEQYLKYKKEFQTNFDKLTSKEKIRLNSLRDFTASNLEDFPGGSSEFKIACEVIRKMQGDETVDMQLFMKKIMKWKVTTQNNYANTFKYMARKYEEGIPKMVFTEDSWGEKGIEDVFKNYPGGEKGFKMSYIRVKAFSQTYMENIYDTKEVTLYRGLNGEPGRRLANNIYKSWKKGGVERSLFPVNDMSLVGYSSEQPVAMDFGTFSVVNGVVNNEYTLVLRQRIAIKDIVLPSDLFDVFANKTASEREFILLGKDKGNWALKDLYLRLKTNKVTKIITNFD